MRLAGRTGPCTYVRVGDGNVGDVDADSVGSMLASLSGVNGKVCGFLGILLFIISILAAGYSLQRLIETRPFFPLGMIQAINDILFVVIILEIMRTVIVRFTDGIFQLDSFLIIGVIAAVRHILTVGASLTMEKEKTTEYFNRALIEMGVNTGIVLALVFALFLSRAARKGNPAK